jgi:hypothetical protein
MHDPGIGRDPAFAKVLALCEPASGGLVKHLGGRDMRGQGMAIGVCSGPLVLPGFTTICTAYHAAKLYSGHEEVGILRR